MKRYFVGGAAALALVALLGLGTVAIADPVGGPFSGKTRVDGAATNVHRVMYQGGEQADFEIRGDGVTTLSLIVKDQYGRVVISTESAGRAHVWWSVSRTAPYHIYVVNRGIVYNDYTWRAF
jgi:hypothetical protein